jgi:uncharacterized protein (DUF362 family)
MSIHSRRDFIVSSAAAASVIAVRPDQVFADDNKPVDMTITRWSGAAPTSNAEIDKIAGQLAVKAIEGLGGMKRFVKQGAKVWVKPNIGWDRTPEYAANTNPEVVAAIVRMCREAGAASVTVGDNTCNVDRKCYVSSGIADAATKAGAEVVFLDPSRFKETDINGQHIKSIPIFPAILESDLVINVPIVKHHVLAKATMCMKNYMGVIDNRKAFHQNIPGCLVDITRFMKPQICILDAVRILKDHGPRGGKLEDVETKLTLAAGVDIVALDAWGSEQLGHKPTDIESVVQGAQAGLGKIDYRSLALREIAVS